ncbi:TRAP transporter fused permease subunit [Cetobacterium sp. 2A]|uniref:TRAP transporter permease n=1 Tax=Cetobacterium sp. 2A TaxID=2754723 RepID=UPI00163BF7D5|nr:TRAP transporter permease [Cetobacterium sp. 2A]MBC2854960.1 TRAP transporter fused permease subunit [Cetobacterium sp. 2A]
MKKIINSISVLMALFHIAVFTFIPIKSGVLYSFHLLFGMVLIFLGIFTTKKEASFIRKLIGIILIILTFVTTIYIIKDYDTFAMRIQIFPENIDILMGILTTIIVLEGTRRSAGNALPIIAIISILYAFYGMVLPGVFGHRGYDLTRVVSTIYSEQGIFGSSLGVSATNVFLFVLFASFLNSSGADKIFQDLSLAIAGKKRGGPAKIAVLSSTFFGSISGSAVANVVSTGAFTIPMMKKQGYRGVFAGAVEAVASTGGQIMPPIMGAAAFILSDLAGVKYSVVCLAALIPALMYYFTLFIMVDIESIKENKKPLDSSQIPNLKKVLKESLNLFIPVIVLLYLLIFNQSTPMISAISAIVAILLCSIFNKKRPLSLTTLIDGCSGGAKSSLQVIAACATSGIVVGMLSLTGLGLKLSNIIINFSQGNLIASLVLAMLVSSVLGMGLPTTAAYIIAATSVTPALIKLGVTPLSAHLFVLYYSAISAITPPVAVASYAAAALAEENPMKVGIEAVRLGLVAFIVPFAFVLNPRLLNLNFEISTILTIVFALISCLSLAYSLQGWLLRKITIVERIILFVVAVILVHPNFSFAIAGSIIFTIVFVHNKIRVKKSTCIDSVGEEII